MDELSVQARDSAGRTPLFLAAFFSRREIVQLLLLQVKDMDASLALAPWKGGHIGMTPEVVLRRRGLFDIIEDIRAKRDAIRKKEEAEEAARQAEMARLQEIADRNRERIENKLRVRLEKIAAGEKEHVNRGFQKWCAFVDSIKFGKYDDLANADLNQMTKRELTKHLQARGHSLDSLGRLGHFPLKQMLQRSLWDEADAKGLHNGNKLTNQMTLKTFGRALESEEDPEKKKAMMKELKERKKAARATRKAEAAARRATNVQRYSTKMTASPGRKSMQQRKLEALREKHKALRALSMAAEGEHESETDEDDSTEHNSHIEVQNISDEELGLDAAEESGAGDSEIDVVEEVKKPRPGMSKTLSVRSAEQFEELGLGSSMRMKSFKSKNNLTLNIADAESTAEEEDVDGSGDAGKDEHGKPDNANAHEEDGDGGNSKVLRSMRMLGSWRGSKRSMKVQPAQSGTDVNV